MVCWMGFLGVFKNKKHKISNTRALRIVAQHWIEPVSNLIIHN